uniref:Uncharacterized protein n=1 Tax=Ascaris lumbricoides TaxID=6252 RepID=A0A0M3IK66_ASCLU
MQQFTPPSLKFVNLDLCHKIVQVGMRKLKIFFKA